MKVVFSDKAKKYFLKLDKPIQKQIQKFILKWLLLLKSVIEMRFRTTSSLLDTFKNTFPQKALRLFRYRDNLTQAALGKKLGISARHVSGMETGRRTISPRMARKLGEIFGTSYQKFL